MEQMVPILVLVALVGLAALGTVVAVAVLLARRLVLAATAAAGLMALRATSYGVGSRARAARLRLGLRAEVDAARRAVALARASGWPVGDAPLLVERLDRAAVGLDARLRAAAEEPRSDLARRALGALQAEVDTVTGAAAGLREGLLSIGASLAADDLRALGADCAIEARALRRP